MNPNRTPASTTRRERLAQRRLESQTSPKFTRFLVALGIFATVALRNWDLVMYSAQYLMVLAIFIHLAKHRLKFQAGLYLAFYGVFALWCLASAFWAVDTDRVLSGALGIVHFVVLGTALAAYTIAQRSPEFILNCVAWSIAGLVVVLLLLTPTEVWLQALEPTADASTDANRLGSTVRYHPNALGRIASIGTFIWIFKLKSESSHRVLKALVIVALVAVLVLTKSRLSIALLVVLVLLLFFFTARTLAQYLVRAITGLIASLVGIWAVLSIPILYDTIGFRFVAMLGLEGSVDASTSTRAEMTRIAFELFERNPITGVGFQHYSYYYFNEYSGWAETSAHNNYAEILATLGIVGLLSYYTLLVWITYKLFRLLRKTTDSGRPLAAFLFLLAVSQLVADFASISYTSDFIQLLTALLFGWVIVIRNEQRTQDKARRPGRRRSHRGALSTKSNAQRSRRGLPTGGSELP